ncbi:unnamed protein product, partial [Mesorhabditis belari]|uniref:Uncharacterized protein n=1 Tax=Mesorhabditis belari TaxID=2138241 RepID=A0AAF3EAQ0_9BILA
MVYQTAATLRQGRIFRSFNQDLESVCLAVVTFLSGGILMFFLCFIVTKLLQCYKARLRRKRRKALGHDDEEDFNSALATGQMQFEDSDEAENETDEHKKLTNA